MLEKSQMMIVENSTLEFLDQIYDVRWIIQWIDFKLVLIEQKLSKEIMISYH